MTSTAEHRATYADLFRIPEHHVGEILDGVLYSHPRPGPRHARASSSLGVMITPPFDYGRNGPGGWWILDEPELHLGEDILVPDLAGWRRERLPQLPETAGFGLAPDWVAEVLSPATARHDRALKRPRYVHHGVGWLWLIDPDLRVIEAYRQGEGLWTLLQTATGQEATRIPPFEAVALERDALWA